MPPPDNRRPILLGVAIGLIVALVVGLIAFALTREDDGTTTDTTAVTLATTIAPTTVPEQPTTTALVEETTTLPATTEAPTTTAPAPTTTGPDPSGWPSGFVLTLAADDGVHLLGPNGANTIVVPEDVDIALPIPGTQDFVVQDRSGRNGDPAQTAIRRVGPGGAGLLIEPPGDTFLRLHDVRSVGGNPVILYTTDVGDNPDNQLETLFEFRLADGSTVELGPVGGWEAGTSRLHLGGVTVVGEYFAEATSGLLSVRQDGTTIDPRSLGLEEGYDDCSTCPRRFTITPNGQQLAWMDGNELVVVDLGTGAEVKRAGVPGDLAAAVADISLFDGIAVLNRTASGLTNDVFGNAVIVDLRGSAPVFVDLPVPGFATR
jgi:hypothetical protein